MFIFFLKLQALAINELKDKQFYEIINGTKIW